MSEFLEDPSVLTKEQLKTALLANNVVLPSGEQRKSVYVELYLRHLTSPSRRSTTPDLYSSDDERRPVSNSSRSARKATKKTDGPRLEEIDVTELTTKAETSKVDEKKVVAPPSEPLQTDRSQNGNTASDQYSDEEEFLSSSTAEPEPEPESEPVPEPVPVVERSLRSRGKPSVTTRTRSGQHKGLSWEAEPALLAKYDPPSVLPHKASTRPSKDLIHMMCRHSPPPLKALDKFLPPPYSQIDSPCRLTREDPLLVSKRLPKDYSASKVALLCGKQTKIHKVFSPHFNPVYEQDHTLQRPLPIEKLFAVEHTPKPAERDFLKEMFPDENLNTHTGMSATRRSPIKGAAGRPISDNLQDTLRARFMEHKQTTSSYTESRSVHCNSVTPLSAIPFSAVTLSNFPKSAAPPSVRAKAWCSLPVWAQLLLLGAVAAFFFSIYQAMEANKMNPFGQPDRSSVLDSTSQ
ncbi:thymopoietin a isoform X2 [Hoplias malabaricus]|uniref:thymopoietin a isoform X2 n=1 Tax=Hoplias malabaricus TaxID=27720 RepID=UPI003461CD32